MTNKLDLLREQSPQYEKIPTEQLLEGLHKNYYSDMDYDDFKDKALKRFDRGVIKTNLVGVAESVESAIPNMEMSFAKLGQVRRQLAGSDIVQSDLGKFLGRISPVFNAFRKTKIIDDILEKKGIDIYGKAEKMSDDYKYKFKLTDRERQTVSGKIGTTFGSAYKFVAYAPFGLTAMGLDVFGGVYKDIDSTNPEWSENKKLAYSFAHALPETLLEKWGTAQLLDPFINGIAKTTLKTTLTKSTLFLGVKQGLKNFVKEGGQEASQELASNIIDKLYQKDVKLFDNMTESFFLGGLVGHAFGMSAGMINAHTSKKMFRESLAISNFSPTETKTLETAISKVVTNEVMANQDGVVEALEMVANSDVLNELPDATVELAEKLKEYGMPEEDIVNMANSLSVEDQSMLNDQFKVAETEDDVKVYEQAKQYFTETIKEAGYTEKEANRFSELYNSFVATSAKMLGKTRREVFKDVMPDIQRSDVSHETSSTEKGSYNAIKRVMTLMPTADTSTFLHETGHVFFDFYLKNMPSMANDVIKWAGVGNKSWDKLNVKEKTRVQEAFARGFEVYLAEGKAPTKSLATSFNEFKEWLLGTYGDISKIMKQGGFDFEISDDIRKLYDSMLNETGEIIIDKTIKPTIGQETLYQKEQAELQRMRKQYKVIKKASKKKNSKIDASEVEALKSMIDAINTVDNVKSPRWAKERAEEDWQESVSAQVYENKIKITPEFKKMAKRYGVPAGFMTNEEFASSADQVADELGLETEEMLETLADEKSKKDYIKKRIDVYKEELASVIDIDETQALIKQLKKDVEAESVTGLQREVIKRIRDMKLDPVYKIKFLGQIQKAKTITSQQAVLNNMEIKEMDYYNTQILKVANSKIAKLVKKMKPKIDTKKGKTKFTYSDTEVFKEIYRINKLTKAEARREQDNILEAFDDSEIPDRTEKLLRMFTEYKARGIKDGFPVLSFGLYDELTNAYKQAKEAKDNEDFNKRMNKSKRVNDFLSGMDNVKFQGTKEDLKGKSLQVYLSNFGNIGTMINAIAGKEQEEALNSEIAESNRNTAIHQSVNKTIKDILTVFGKKHPLDFLKILDSFQERGEFKLVEREARYEDRKPLVRTFDFLGILDIYNAIKNDKTRNDYFMAYGKDNVLALVNKLTSQERDMADIMMRDAIDHYDMLNKKHIETYGIALPQRDEYWMRTSMKPKDSLVDNQMVADNKASFFKSSAKGITTPMPMNAWVKYQEFMAGAKHVEYLQDKWIALRTITDSDTIKQEIADRYGKQMMPAMRQAVDRISLHGVMRTASWFNKMVGKTLSNWTRAKIAVNPSVYLKQTISMNNYATSIPAGEWAKYFAEGVAHHKETLDFMFKNSPYLTERFHRGYDKDIKQAQIEMKKLATSKQINDVMTGLAKIGDIQAIVYGGYPVIKYYESQGLSIEEAETKFRQATIKGQQSGLESSLSNAQADPNNRLWFTFKNTPTQYLRQNVNAIISYQNGDISGKEASKILAVYGVIQPSLYVMAEELIRHGLYGKKDDDDDDNILERMLKFIIFSPANAIPIAGDILKTIGDISYAKASGKKIKYVDISIPTINDTVSSLKALNSSMQAGLDDFTLKDFIDITAPVIELTKGVPVKTAERIVVNNINRFKD